MRQIVRHIRVVTDVHRTAPHTAVSHATDIREAPEFVLAVAVPPSGTVDSGQFRIVPETGTTKDPQAIRWVRSESDRS